MAMTPVVFTRALLTTGNTDYTVAASTTATVTNIVLANETSSTDTVTILLNGIDLIPAVTVPAYSTVTFDLKQVVPTGQVIRATSAAGSRINCHISGVTIT